VHTLASTIIITVLGWNRQSVEVGLHELHTGIICRDNYPARGNKKTEEKLSALESDIRSLVDAHSQADPQMKTTLAYTRLTAQAVRQALLGEKGYREGQLPTVHTISTVLNRLGYRLRTVQKTKPQKKRRKQTLSLPMSGRSTNKLMSGRQACVSA
jgi:DDE family transposase